MTENTRPANVRDMLSSLPAGHYTVLHNSTELGVIEVSVSDDHQVPVNKIAGWLKPILCNSRGTLTFRREVGPLCPEALLKRIDMASSESLRNALISLLRRCEADAEIEEPATMKYLYHLEIYALIIHGLG